MYFKLVNTFKRAENHIGTMIKNTCIFLMKIFTIGDLTCEASLKKCKAKFYSLTQHVKFTVNDVLTNIKIAHLNLK